MPTTWIDLIRAHTRLAVLRALREGVTDDDPGRSQLMAMPAWQIESAIRQPALQLLAAVWAITGEPLSAQNVITAVATSAQQVGEGPWIVNGDPLLPSIAGSHADQPIAAASTVAIAWAEGLDVLESIKLDSLIRIVRCVSLLAGFEGKVGEISAFSNASFPGFVGININCPAALLAEQMVHEATHVVFAAMLKMQNRFDLLLQSEVGVLSPFVDSVRTAERVAHGLLSYGVVLEFWQALAGHPQRGEWLGGIDSAAADRCCYKRIDTVTARLELAELALMDATGVEIVALVREVYQELIGHPPRWDSSEKERAVVVTHAGWKVGVDALPPIEQAEALLAFAGEKVSRIGVSLRDSARIGFGLLGLGAVTSSAWAVKPLRDQALAGFSNVIAARPFVLSADTDDEIFFYLSREAKQGQQAEALDRTDEAGELLDIPACCRDAFAERWPTVIAMGGDIFAFMLRMHVINGMVKLHSECDASAMYRGGGLCWHFPCAPHCAETIALIEQRRRWLNGFSPALLEKLDEVSAKCLSLDSTGVYTVLVPGVTSCIDVTILGS